MLIKPIGFKLTGMPFHHRIRMGVILIHNSKPALLKQKPFTCQIFLEICMLIGADMIRLQVGKNPDLKGKPLGSVKLKPLRRHFHHNNIAALFLHLPEILLKQEGFRRGIVRGNMLISYDCLNCSHKPYLIACSFQDRLDQVSGSGLSLSAGNADHLQPVSRMSEISGRNIGHGISAVLYPDHRNITFRRQLHILLHHQRRRSRLCRLPGKLMPVGLITADTDKHTSRFELTGIINHLFNFTLHVSPSTFPFKSVQQFSTSHMTPPCRPKQRQRNANIRKFPL